MDSSSHPKAKEIFVAACDVDPEGREEFVKRACEGDANLRREVESLLAYHETGDSTQTSHGSGPDLEQIRDYRLIRKIGEGGMGEVYEAEQLRPVRRRVAIKVIKQGMDTKHVVARFESERQALALMQHPNIARVFDAGSTAAGRPFFSMEYVSGEPITRYCDRQRLDTAARLDLFLQVCDGVQHAHQKGVIHRDIKPSNVLVRVQADRAVPVIIDFGIAKAIQHRLTEKTMFTAAGIPIGTPEYMSPEQAEMTGLDVDTRTDVYSLGVLLYELLTGVLPLSWEDLRAAGFDEIRRKIREDEPSKPSTRVTTLGGASGETASRRRTDPVGLRKLLRGDLDWITMKALEKDPTRRYGASTELASDIRRHLRHEPVSAGPPAMSYRLGKFVKRHRFGVAAGAVLTIALLGGIAGTTIGLVRARHEAQTSRRVSGVLEALLRDLNPGTLRGHARGPEQMLDRAIERIDTELAGEPLLQGRLLESVGRTSYWLGYFDRAEKSLEKSIAILSAELGADHPDVAFSMGTLGYVLYEIGDYKAALDLQERVLAIRRTTLAPGDRWLAVTLGQLGMIHWRRSEFEKAGSRFDESLRLPERPSELRLVDHASNLVLRSLLETDQREYPSATRHLREALEIKREILGPDHPETGLILQALGRVQTYVGDLVEARETIERGMQILSNSLGADHVSLSSAHRNLGRLFTRTGEYETAREHLDRSLYLTESTRGDEHPNVVWCLRSLALLEVAVGADSRARPLYERGLRIAQQRLGPDHLEVSRLLHDLGGLDYRAGDLDRARDLYARALRIQRRVYGPGHRALGALLVDHARVSSRLGLPDEAVTLLREAVESTAVDTETLREEAFRGLRGRPDFDVLVSGGSEPQGGSPGSTPR